MLQFFIAPTDRPRGNYRHRRGALLRVAIVGLVTQSMPSCLLPDHFVQKQANVTAAAGQSPAISSTADAGPTGGLGISSPGTPTMGDGGTPSAESSGRTATPTRGTTGGDRFDVSAGGRQASGTSLALGGAAITVTTTDTTSALGGAKTMETSTYPTSASGGATATLGPRDAAGGSRTGSATAVSSVTGGAPASTTMDRAGMAGADASSSAGAVTDLQSTQAGAAGFEASSGSDGIGAAAGASGAAGSGTTAGGSTAGSGATVACPNQGGPTMKALPQGYCIDCTEVSRGQYAAWLATEPAVADQNPDDCGWNSDFAPSMDCMDMVDGGQPCTNCDNFPVVCVDWCDAVAYCKAMGKRLCGRIGGGTNSRALMNDPSQSQWYSACSSGGLHPIYSYGDVFNASACNGYLPSKGGAIAEVSALSFMQCTSPEPSYAGIYHLLGNVWEWEDSCSGSYQSAYCLIRGGGVGSDYPADTCLRCDFQVAHIRADHSQAVGFRCCS